MPSPPSTASSASSSSEAIPPPATGSHRDPPLQPPRPLFFIDKGKGSTTDIVEEERRDPFRSPDTSVPPTPAPGQQDANPFSPPASIISVGSVGTLGDSPHITIAAHSRVQSRVSVGSSLRGSSADLPIGPRPGLGSRVSSQIRDSFMSPPAMMRRTTAFSESNAASRLSVAAPKSKRMRSSMLVGEIEKPWVGEKDVHGRMAWWITYVVAFIGIAGSVLRCYFAWRDVPRVGNICLIMEDNFDTFDTEYTWQQEVDMGGFG